MSTGIIHEPGLPLCHGNCAGRALRIYERWEYEQDTPIGVPETLGVVIISEKWQYFQPRCAKRRATVTHQAHEHTSTLGHYPRRGTFPLVVIVNLDVHARIL